ncbi:hypothetical protein CDAR_387651 [Caerostris darwini]|uniref:Secreted protein n=1 Tax=Caerostris darwini TaxID=1538125 RepID=A0AAV4THM3_9ARAC|nr:hypothetical protein CDAR_387651 [Caerostris darwini]
MLTLALQLGDRGGRCWLMASCLAASNEICGCFFGLRNTALKSESSLVLLKKSGFTSETNYHIVPKSGSSRQNGRLTSMRPVRKLEEIKC